MHKINRRELLKTSLGLGMSFALIPNALQAHEQPYHVYQIEDGGLHWISARNFDEALERHALQGWQSIQEYLDEYDEVEIDELDDDEILEVRNMETDEIMVKSCKEWAKECQQYGFVATTEW